MGVRPARYFGDKRLDHVLLELPLEIDHVIGDADLLGHAAGVVNIVQRTAASGGAFVRQFGEPPLIPELHGEPDHGMALTHQ